MRVGIDVGPIARARTGVGNYCYHLLKHLLQLEGEHSLVGFYSGLSRGDLSAFEGAMRTRYVRLPTRALYAVWNAFERPHVDRLLGGVDVYHATNYFLPPVATARRVVTVHDLSFLVLPELSSPKIVSTFTKGVRRFCAEADAVIADSYSTKRDIVERLDVSDEKVTVVHLAANEGFAPVDRGEAQARLARAYRIEGPYLFFVSTIEPRKNVEGLLRAFAQLTKDFPHKLILAGSLGWYGDTLIELIRELRIADRIVCPGFVPDEDLPSFYSAADAFVFPSHYEGFGLPVLEAMACGCPVVTAKNSSLPEVVGEAALLADSKDFDGLAEQMRRVLSEPGLREALSAKGKAQAATFSWARSAEETMRVYKKLLT